MRVESRNQDIHIFNSEKSTKNNGFNKNSIRFGSRKDEFMIDVIKETYPYNVPISLPCNHIHRGFDIKNFFKKAFNMLIGN